jgi:hypothetical protein
VPIFRYRDDGFGPSFGDEKVSESGSKLVLDADDEIAKLYTVNTRNGRLFDDSYAHLLVWGRPGGQIKQDVGQPS